MNFDSIVAADARPWLPAPDASNLDVWHEDDVPVLGTFDLPDGHVLFTLVGAADKAVTTWAYLPLEVSEYKELQETVYDSVLKMNEDVHRRFEARHCVFAVARDFSISSWTPTDEPVKSVLQGATEFMQDYVALVSGEVELLNRRLEKLQAIHTAQRLRSTAISSWAAENWMINIKPTRTPKSEQDQIEAFEETQARAEHLV